MLRLAALLNIKADEILAVGDGANDVEMLRSVGIGAAVKNASDAAKKFIYMNGCIHMNR